MSQIIARLDIEDDAEVLDRDTRQLLREISQSVDPDARLAERPAEPGARSGMAPMLGEIAMAMISSGAIVALLEILKAYFSRKKAAKFALTRPDGASISIELDDVTDDQFENCIKRMEAFFGQAAT